MNALSDIDRGWHLSDNGGSVRFDGKISIDDRPAYLPAPKKVKLCLNQQPTQSVITSLHALLTRERIEQKKEIPVWIYPCDRVICSPNNNSSIYQCISVANDLSPLLFSRRLPSVSHDHKKHQSKVSHRKPGGPPGHLFRTNA
jgi:hypothetical protein